MARSTWQCFLVLLLFYVTLASADSNFYDDDEDEDLCYYDDVGDWSKCDPLLKRQFMKQVIVSGGPTCLKEQTINRTCVAEKTKKESLKISKKEETTETGERSVTNTPTFAAPNDIKDNESEHSSSLKQQKIRVQFQTPSTVSPKEISSKKEQKHILRQAKDIPVTTPSFGNHPPLPPKILFKHRKPNPRQKSVHRKPNPPSRPTPLFKGKPATFFPGKNAHQHDFKMRDSWGEPHPPPGPGHPPPGPWHPPPGPWHPPPGGPWHPPPGGPGLPPPGPWHPPPGGPGFRGPPPDGFPPPDGPYQRGPPNRRFMRSLF